MFSYPYGASSYGYSSPYSYARPTYSSPDAAYLRALADERTARDQYLAARRAQEDARARLANAHTRYVPHSSYIDDGLDDEYDSYDAGIPLPSSSYGFRDAYARRLMEEQRRREQLELERERERREREMERRRLEEERRKLKEERCRMMEEDRLRRMRDAQRQYDPFLRSFGWTPDDIDDEMIQGRTGRTPLRAQTVSPSHRRQPSRTQRSSPLNTHLNADSGLHPNARSSSLPSRQSPSSPTSTSNTVRFSVPMSTPPPVTQPQAQSASSPRTAAAPPSPRHKPADDFSSKFAGTDEEHAAASTLQRLFRAHRALRTIASLWSRFLRLKSEFHFPVTLNFTVDGRTVTVSVPAQSTPASNHHKPSDETNDELPARHPLAYTSNNALLHGCLEGLSCLLSSADAVESHSDSKVREARKALVRVVEGEASAVEARVVEVWKAYQGADKSEAATHHEQSAVEPRQEQQETELYPESESFREAVEEVPARAEEASVEPQPSQEDQAPSTTTQAPAIIVEPTPPAEEQTSSASAEQPTVAGLDSHAMDSTPDPDVEKPEMTIEVIEAEPDQAEGDLDVVDADPEPARIEAVSEQYPQDEQSMQLEPPAEPTEQSGEQEHEGWESDDESRIEEGPAPSEVPQTPEVDIQDEDIDAFEREDAAPAAKAPAIPEVEFSDAPDENGVQTEQPQEAQPVVEDAPTPEIDIPDADIDEPVPDQDTAPAGSVSVETQADAHADASQVASSCVPTLTHIETPLPMPAVGEHPSLSTPILSPSLQHDADSSSEGEGPCTPPLHAQNQRDEVSAPVIVITSADVETLPQSAVKETMMGDNLARPTAGEQRLSKRRDPLVNRDWMEVETFDIF